MGSENRWLVARRKPETARRWPVVGALSLAGLLAGFFFRVGAPTAQQPPVLPGTAVSPVDGAEMVLVGGGEFVFGIQDKAALKRFLKTSLGKPWLRLYDNEIVTKTKRRLPDYYIDKYEVTNAQYELFLKANSNVKPPRFWTWPQFNGKRQPVVGLTWKDAEAYAKWAGKRLATDEEWEKAARGTDGRTWPWGNDFRGADAKYNGKKKALYASAAVGSTPEGNSPYGVSDMAGNVWEWTSNEYDATSHVMRGGSFLNDLAEVRTTVRWASSREQTGAEYLGFRCVMDPSALRQRTAR